MRAAHLSGERTGVKQGTRPSCRAKSRVSTAVQHEPLSDRCSTGCGARSVPNLHSTAASIMSRTSEPLIPAPVTATWAMTSRSKASMNETLFAIGSRTMVECHPDLFSVPARDLAGIRAPSEVRSHDGDLAVVKAGILYPGWVAALLRSVCRMQRRWRRRRSERQRVPASASALRGPQEPAAELRAMARIGQCAEKRKNSVHPA